MRYRVVNLGQVQQNLPPTCPAIPQVPGLNCQRAPNGGVICSDGTYFPPGCTNIPPITTPGVTTYVRNNGSVSLAKPPPFDLGQETGTEFPWLLVGIAAAGAVIAIVF